MNLPCSGLHHIRVDDADRASARLRADGRIVFVLGPGILTKGALIEALKSNVPLTPMLVSGRRWDAVIDSIAGGLLDEGPGRYAIVWSGYAALLDAEELKGAIAAFEAVIGRVSDRPGVELAVFLVR